MKRSALIGAGVGLALGMPLFEVSLLMALALDGELFHTAYTIKYFSSSANLIALLAVLHAITGAAGALVGAIMYQAKNRRKLRVIPGGAGRVH